LVASHDDCLVDIFYQATARQVVDRSAETLENRTYCYCTCKTLNKLVSDVTDFE
jgi:hypothetical protein